MVRRMMIAAVGIAMGLAVTPAKAQVLEIATDQSPVGLDPHVATAFSTTMVLSTIYEGLTAIDLNCTWFRAGGIPGPCRPTA